MSKFEILMAGGCRNAEDLKLAKETGFNWVITSFLGHSDYAGDLQDNLPVFFKRDKEISRSRRKHYPEIRTKIEKLKSLNQAAHRQGLKVAIFTYEPSFPVEVQQAHPEFFYPEPAEFLKQTSADNAKRSLCLYDPRAREFLADKAEELLRNISPVDAWIYTTNEVQWGSSAIDHICANCFRKERWQALRFLRDAMKEGAGRLPYKVEMVHRFWGAHHPKGFRAPVKYMLKNRPLSGALKRNAVACVKILEPKVFDPNRDIPKFMKSLEEESVKPWIMSKATWTDFLLHQPVNPWVGFSQGKVKEIMELSVEPSFRESYGFIPCLLLKQMQNHLRYGLKRGVYGLMFGPVKGAADWGINLANLEVSLKLLKNPKADLGEILSGWLAKKYGGCFPNWLVRALLDTENIWAKLAAYNGISGMENFDEVMCPRIYTSGSLKNYLWPQVYEVFPDGKERFDLSPAGISKAIATWNKEVGRAHRLNEKIKKEVAQIPLKARNDVLYFFDRLARTTLYLSLNQKILYTRMALEFKKIKQTPALIRVTERWHTQLYYLIANDEDIRKGYCGRQVHTYKNVGWKYNDVTEADVFKGLKNVPETLVD